MNRQMKEMWAMITADRKKAAVLGALVFVAGAMWVRAALKTTPSSASASSDKSQSSSKGSKAAQNEADAEEQKLFTRVVELPPPPALTRDLFALSDVLLAKSSQTDDASSTDPKSAIGSDDKSVSAPALTPEERAAADADSLRLRSTMVGNSPTAVIERSEDGRRKAAVVRVGDEINGFTVVGVRAAAVELEKYGVRIELTRQQR